MENSDKKEDEESKAKKLAVYNASVSTWFTTKLERDKQLLGLSVTGIGLLVTLLRIVGASSYLQLWLFIGSLVFFLITVISTLCIFDQNAVHIGKALKGDEQESELLKKLDGIAAFSFVVAMIFIIIIGINYSLLNLSEKGKNMSKEQINTQGTFKVQVNDSVNGFMRILTPPPPEKKPTTSQTGSNSTSASATAGGNEIGNNTTSNKAD